MNFQELEKINVNDKIEKKKAGSVELSYLSWAYAVSKFKEAYPDFTYEIKKFDNGNGVLLPYMYDENTGYMVMTSITAGGLTQEMWLPVMDSSNKAMKNAKYSYETKEYVNGRATGNILKKYVESATMFDVNKTIMRCLVKNMAMFGLGLYIYAGEDLPTTEPEEKTDKPAKSDFEKDATNEMRANTVARKKGEKAEPKGTLEERYTKACYYLMSNDGKGYKRSVIDSLNKLYDDLINAGEKEKAEDLKVGIDRIIPLDDEIVY